MNCYFLRHGIAVEPAQWQGRDEERPLTPEGCKRMEHAANAIAELLPELELIVTSPLVRARQTADFVAKQLQLRNVVADERIAHGFNARACQAILTEHPDAESVMLVGHEPSMSAAIGHMIGDGNVELKKAALAAIELAERTSTSGTLLFLIPPKVLVRWGKSI